jgi:hypothetical protein
MSALAMALAPLHEAERRLSGAVDARASLDPARPQATALPVLGERMLREVPDPAHWSGHGRALAALALAQLEHFPQNVLWDLDYPALCMARAAQGHAGGAAAYVARCSELLTELHAAYGRHSVIRFRYVHDFVYGFDWERWVNADAPQRRVVGPFDLPFLERSLERSRELERAIREGHPSYPRLAPGEFRNPFGFSREPAAELTLHRALLAQGAIAVPSFDPDAQPDAGLGSSKRREALAVELGLNLQG